MATSERRVSVIGCRPSAVNQWLAHRPGPTSILLDKPIVEIRPAGKGRGLGLFTYSPIQAFSQIIADPPLILMQPGEDVPELYDHFLNLPEEQKRTFLALSFRENSERDSLLHARICDRGLNSKHDADSLAEMVKVANIMQNNAFNVNFRHGPGPCHRAAFPKIARINHSCAPNVHVCFCPSSDEGDTKGHMVVHALRNLEVGEEILISYFNLILPEQERQKRARNWGFDCLCPICSDELPETEGEKLRTNLQKFHERQVEIMQNKHVKLREVNPTIEFGKMLVERALKQSSVYPTLPDLYDALGLLRAKAAFLQKQENNREETISLLEQAALWEAKITGPKSPHTMYRLFKLSKFAAKKGSTQKALVSVDDKNEYQVVWQG